MNNLAVKLNRAFENNTIGFIPLTEKEELQKLVLRRKYGVTIDEFVDADSDIDIKDSDAVFVKKEK